MIPLYHITDRNMQISFDAHKHIDYKKLVNILSYEKWETVFYTDNPDLQMNNFICTIQNVIQLA